MNKRKIKNRLVGFVSFAAVFAGAISVVSGKGYTALFAHETQLSVGYDACVPLYYSNAYDIGDGEFEKWYELIKNGETWHLPHSSGTTQIMYYISDMSPDGYTSWNDIVDPTRREYVKNSLINSLLKWNNVYFYKITSSNVISKYRIANISEGTSSNNNLVLYPDNSLSGAYASCGPTSSAVLIDAINGINHNHYSNWEIRFRLTDHYNYSLDSEFILERTGAHELGHVFGLRDIDGCENSSSSNYHHEELLMGYSQAGGSLQDRQKEITYKDLVGAAITRGLHTDFDHMWLYDSDSSTSGNYKLICSICNGVKYVDSLNNLDYLNYKYCNDEHDLQDGNMFAVASYQTKDYFKCKYCRYVAPFTDIVNQNYSRTSYNNLYHLVTNQVFGLGYSFYEPHIQGFNGNCILCGYHMHSHSYNDHYLPYSNTKHKAYCSCGASTLQSHAVDIGNTYVIGDHTYGNCLSCGAMVDLGNGFLSLQPGILMVTDNGSVMLPNEIYVLVEEDFEEYFNGTLFFHLYGEMTY